MTVDRIVYTREAAHDAAREVYAHAQALLMDGKRVHIRCSKVEEALTLRQLRFIHGPVLQQISEQVVVSGTRYTRDIWKAHLKDLFIPAKFVMQRAPFVRDARTGEWRQSKRAVPVKVKPSLKDLTGRARSDFIDQVLAHAATEWGVEFRFIADEREAVRWHPPVRKARAAVEEGAPA